MLNRKYTPPKKITIIYKNDIIPLLLYTNFNMKKISLRIIVIAVIVFIIGAIGYFYSNKKSDLPIIKTEIIMRIGDREESFSLQKINADSLDGLWYQIYPVARVDDIGEPKTLHIGDNIGYACAGVSEKLTKIDFVNQTAIFVKITSEPTDGGCPI